MQIYFGLFFSSVRFTEQRLNPFSLLETVNTDVSPMPNGLAKGEFNVMYNWWDIFLHENYMYM